MQASLPRTVSDELPGVGSLGPWAAQPRSVTLPRALHGGPASARVNQPRGKGLSGRFPCSRGQVARLEWRGWNSTAPADGFPSGRSRLPLAKLRPGPRVPRPSLRRKSSPGRTGHSVGACRGHVCVPANPRAPRFWGTPLPAPQALCRGLSPPPSPHHVAEPLRAGACSRPYPFSGCTSCSPACHGYGLCLSCHPEECPPHLPLRPGLRLGAPGPPVPGPAAWWGSMGAGAETEGGPWPERLPARRLQPRGEEASTAGVAMALCCYLRGYVASKAGTSESY